MRIVPRLAFANLLTNRLCLFEKYNNRGYLYRGVHIAQFYSQHRPRGSRMINKLTKIRIRLELDAGRVVGIVRRESQLCVTYNRPHYSKLLRRSL